MKTERDITQLYPPAVPMWAVFYNPEDDSLRVEPIVTLALIKNSDHNRSFHDILPMTCSDVEMCDLILDDYLLGYSTNQEPNRDEFESIIADIRYERQQKSNTVELRPG